MSANLKKSENPNFTTNEKGQSRYAKGNTIGRMPKKGYTLNDLTNMAMEYDGTNDVSILKHYIEQLKKDNRLLENFINRYIPQKQEMEIKVPDTIRIKHFIQAGKEPVIEEEEELTMKEKEVLEEPRDEQKEGDIKEIETVI